MLLPQESLSGLHLVDVRDALALVVSEDVAREEVAVLEAHNHFGVVPVKRVVGAYVDFIPQVVFVAGPPRGL